ncbi:MAG: hypothetical protein M3282_06135 [Gemmatimonadota bacterium]|nr:hypothetical protein [Gemmatimonadota bacterium]
MSRTFSPRAFALVAMVAIACQPMPPRSEEPGAPPASGVMITLDRTRYAPGSRVEMRVTNHTSETRGFNPCTRSVERRQGDSWVMVPEPGRVCTMEIWLVNPHGSRAGTTELPAWLPRGTYRLALILTREGGGPPAPTVRALSEPFQVE